METKLEKIKRQAKEKNRWLNAYAVW